MAQYANQVNWSHTSQAYVYLNVGKSFIYESEGTISYSLDNESRNQKLIYKNLKQLLKKSSEIEYTKVVPISKVLIF